MKEKRNYRACKVLFGALILGTSLLGAKNVGAQSDATDPEEMKKELRQLKARMQQLKSALEEAEELDRMRSAAIERALKILEGDAAAMEPKPPELPDRPASRAAAAPRRRPPAPKPPATGSIRGSVQIPSGEPVAYVFVENVRGPAVNRKVTIEQVQKQFTPSWAVVQRGTTVDFPNLDNIYHNVFSLSPGNSFDLGLYAAGAQAKSHTFTEAGGVDVYCNIHPNMAASILVVPSKHFAKVGADGSFQLADVPAGRRKLTAWSPGSLLSSEWVELRAGGQAEVTLRLSPKGSGHTRKDGRPYGSYQ